MLASEEASIPVFPDVGSMLHSGASLLLEGQVGNGLDGSFTLLLRVI